MQPQVLAEWPRLEDSADHLPAEHAACVHWKTELDDRRMDIRVYASLYRLLWAQLGKLELEGQSGTGPVALAGASTDL